MSIIRATDVAKLMAIAGDGLELCRRVVTAANPALGIPASEVWQCRKVTGYVMPDDRREWAVSGPTPLEPGRSDTGGYKAYLSSIDFNPVTLGESEFLKYNGAYYQLTLNSEIRQKQYNTSVPLLYCYTIEERRSQPVFRRT